MKRKVALVVSGGGSHGAFAVGVLDELRHRCEFTAAAGTSTGALIAPLVATNEIDELVHLYSTVQTKHVIRKNWRRLFWNALYDTKPLQNLIERTINEPGRYEAVLTSSIPVLLCSVSLQTKKIRYFTQRLWPHIPQSETWVTKDGFVKAVLGSTNQPFLMPPVDLFGQQQVDGGVRETVPIEVLADAGYQRIITIVNSPSSPSVSSKQYGNLASVGFRAVSIMLDEIKHNDLRYPRELYALQRALGLSNTHIDVIRPSESLPGNGLTFDPPVMRHMIRLGRDAARRFLCTGLN